MTDTNKENQKERQHTTEAIKTNRKTERKNATQT